MEPEARYTLVGAVVLVLIALLVGVVLWLGSSERNDALHFTIYFERQSLEGLEPRSDVRMRGVRVGSVTGLRFAARRPGAVEVTIAVHPATPVRQSTQATVERHVVTGLATVLLTNTTEDSPFLRQAPEGEANPVIAEGESRLEQFSETLTQLAERTNEAMQRLNEMMSDRNREAVSEIVENLRRVSKHADGTLARADAALGAVTGAAADVRTLARALADDAAKLAQRYDALGVAATTSVEELGAATRAVQADAARLARRLDTLIADGDDDLRATAQALRSAADAVTAAASRLRDPGQAIFGPAAGGLGPGEGGASPREAAPGERRR